MRTGAQRLALRLTRARIRGMQQLHFSRMGFRQSDQPDFSFSASTPGFSPTASAQMHYDQLRQEMGDRMAARVQAVHDHNAAIAQKVDQAWKASAPRLAAADESVNRFAHKAENLHDQATALFGMCAAVQPYNRERPDPQAPFMPRAMNMDQAIEERGLGTLHLRPKWAYKLGEALMTFGVGLLFGWNIGVKMGMLEPELQVNLEPDRLPSFIGAMMMGLVLSLVVGAGAKSWANKAASQRNLRGWTWPTWAAMIGSGVVSLLLIAGDVALQMSSLMTQAQMTSLDGQSMSPLVYALMSILFVLGYVGAKNFMGWSEGLNNSAEQIARQHIAKVQADEEARRRQDPTCCEASAFAHRALAANTELATAESARLALQREAETRVKDLEGQKRSAPTALQPEEASQLREAELRMRAELAQQEDLAQGSEASMRAMTYLREADAEVRRRASLH